MIKVLLKKDEIQITGHAGFDINGKDIVCASVSSIVYTTINAILNFNNTAINVVDKKDLIIKIISTDHITNGLINNMVQLLEELQQQYPDYIKIK